MVAQEGESTTESKTTPEVHLPGRSFSSDLDENRHSIDAIILHTYLTGWRLQLTTVG